ncbi:ras and Rab interactor 3-like isoform X2 [Pyxicephalus adspersus]|uniref:ras and Rab interactor 3-like isoform X2 n=1 Tax=Pyxicephalus adspersus TaxID=30357 RepID=UPI003B58FFB0
MKLDLPQSNKPGQHFCSIQVTSENGALCIINPLFLHEHGDSWLTHNQAKEKRKSVPWISGEGQEEIRLGPPAEDDIQDGHLSNPDKPTNVCEDSCMEEPKVVVTKDEHLNACCKSQENQSTPKLLRKSVIRLHSDPKRENMVEINETQTSDNILIERNKTLRLSRERKSALLRHRVSWIQEEDILKTVLKKANSDTSLSSSDSFLLPPPPELDSVSISSVEEEGDRCSLRPKRHHSHGLGDIVRHSLLAVSTALTGLVSPEKHLGNRIQQLAEDPSSYLGGIVQTFTIQLQKRSVVYLSSTEMLQALRQLLTNSKNHLLERNETLEILERQEIEEFKIASVIESSLYKCVLKPLQSAIYCQLLEMHNKDGSLEMLLDNQKKMKKWSLSDQKPRAGMPGLATMEKIKQRLAHMHKAYSPEKKIRHLLKVCKHIYESMEASSGKKAFGADDFLPVLINVLLECDLTCVQLDVEYMMELGDPFQLQGEGGYYLTTLFGALYHISTFNTVSRQLSVEAQNSIRQWQRRRTIHHKQTFRKSNQLNEKMSEKYASLLALESS